MMQHSHLESREKNPVVMVEPSSKIQGFLHSPSLYGRKFRTTINWPPNFIVRYLFCSIEKKKRKPEVIENVSHQ